MSSAVWDLVPVRCRWIETLRHCGKTLLRRQRRLLRRIKKVYLHSWRSVDELNMLVGAKVGGATPLVIACRNGHYDVAEYLIERCKADIEQAGSVTFDGETIEGAPPLWCAAAAGHLPLVRLLVRAGANVNSTTRTHSTPLRAACFDGHYDIVKFLVENGADIEIANRHGHTCLMIACYKGHIRIAKYLLSLNADVNRKSVKGNTALHDCAESGSLHILKMLLGHGATMDVDSYGMTPLLAASVTGHTHIVEHLISAENGLVTRQQRIDALELLGATYVDKRRDMVGALALWKRAMDDRFPTDGSPPIPKPKDIPRIEAYEWAAEPCDAAALRELLADPDAMRMQALVLRERILGPAHPDTSYYVRYRGAVYADAGRYGRCRALWHHALDMQRAVLPPLSPLTQSSLYSFAELFAYMRAERARPPHRGQCPPPHMQRAVLPPLSPLTQSSLYSFAELFAYMRAERARPPHRGQCPPPTCSAPCCRRCRRSRSPASTPSRSCSRTCGPSAPARPTEVSAPPPTCSAPCCRRCRRSRSPASTPSRSCSRTCGPSAPARPTEVSAPPPHMQRAVLPPLSPLTQSSLYSFAELFAYMRAERARPPHRGQCPPPHMQRAVLPPLSPLTQSSLYSFAEPLRRIVPPVTFEDIDPVFKKALSEIHRGMELLQCKLQVDREQTLTTLQRVLVIALHLAALLARLLDEPDCGDQDRTAIHQAVYSLVKLDIKVRSGRGALHVACSAEAARARGAWLAAPGDAAPCAGALLALMLRLGAAPHARDARGDTPLHLVCKLNPCPPDVVRELLAHGAHIDTVNYDGETPEEILKASNQSLSSIVNPLKYTTLKCLAARTVKNYKLPYRHVVPQCLHATIINH
ncbi:hypothetical protein MSG28_012517 [Choristoneura fumiferana]|uniref:Uncharacterized protein n=1 Tax=Choristoneura fumiferana TaxID=7141 RepID=A0ACC0KDX1_CHOFU|nr:hypothetical protein MSG28_012517 [Choristoneura fumiferana]